MNTFKVIWNNEHASGSLPEVYLTEHDAEQAGMNWLIEMCGLENPPLNPDDEFCPYSFEVVSA